MVLGGSFIENGMNMVGFCHEESPPIELFLHHHTRNNTDY